MASNLPNPVSLPSDLPAVPVGWKYEQLGQLVDPERGISYGIVQPGVHDPQGVPIVRVDQIRQNRIEPREPLRVSAKIEGKHSRTRLRGGELLLTIVGANFGEAAHVGEGLAGWNVARAVAVIPITNQAMSHWVFLCLRSQVARRYMDIWATTTAQPTLNLRDVARIPVPIPSEAERAWPAPQKLIQVL